MNSNDKDTVAHSAINDRKPVGGIRGVIRGWVNAYVASYEKYYLGFGQGG